MRTVFTAETFGFAAKAVRDRFQYPERFAFKGDLWLEGDRSITAPSFLCAF
jgi:hypothetical protein